MVHCSKPPDAGGRARQTFPQASLCASDLHVHDLRLIHDRSVRLHYISVESCMAHFLEDITITTSDLDAGMNKELNSSLPEVRVGM